MGIIDSFSALSSSLTAPATGGVAITPSDTVDLAQRPRVLYCTGSGNVRVVMMGSGTVTLPMIAGQPLPVRVDRVMVTGTTATGIVGLW